MPTPPTEQSPPAPNYQLGSAGHHSRRSSRLQSRRAWRLLESGWVVWVAARHADHPSAAGAVRHKVKGDRDGEFAYVRAACVERALTCRSRACSPRMLTRTCLALPGRLQEHPNDYTDQLLHRWARLGAQGAARGAESHACDLGRCERPSHGPLKLKGAHPLAGRLPPTCARCVGRRRTPP